MSFRRSLPEIRCCHYLLDNSKISTPQWTATASLAGNALCVNVLPDGNFRVARGSLQTVRMNFRGYRPHDEPCRMFVVGAEKTLGRLLSGTADAAIRFDDLCQLLGSLGFEERVRGSHHLFRKSGVEERINLQRDGTNAKPYQVKQVRSVILKAKLGAKQ